MNDSNDMDESVSAILARALDHAAALRRLPESTYRLQFHKGFTFTDASAIVPYLSRLGITHAYASPYLKATAGSMHGYDVVEHGRLNPEVGGEKGLDQWVDALGAAGMHHILDIVPNHAGVATNDNPWWNDVLENGPSSRYAGFFDIEWKDSPRKELKGRVLLPVLGEPYGQALEKGQLHLAFDVRHGTFSVNYYQRCFPIAPRSYVKILEHRLREAHLLPADDPSRTEYLGLLHAIKNLPDQFQHDSWRAAGQDEQTEHLKRRLAGLAARNAVVHEFIDRSVASFNGSPGDSKSFDLLDDLLTDQSYRLAYWANASDEINYRRFFDVNDLAALSMQRLEVFEATHELILRLLAQGKVAGVRVDHPDGLYDPKQYFDRLQTHYILACARALCPAEDWSTMRQALLEKLDPQIVKKSASHPDWPLYVVAEKILAVDEPLPETWAVHGTSGYDFLNMANGLFVDSANSEKFTRTYEQWIGDKTTFPDLVYSKKCLILQTTLASELNMLAHQLDRLAQSDRNSRDFTLNGLRHALREVIACFPVYRSYITDEGVSPRDREQIELAITSAVQRNPKTPPLIFNFIRDALYRDAKFAGKFQQLTAPVTAKGVEDTAFYIYHRLISLNEVGGDPEKFGVAPAALHAYLKDRQQKWPFALSGLSTHDTKRSEDVRARINVLSEMPDEWPEHVTRWREMNPSNGSPDANEQYLFYQTLIGAWPIEGPDQSFTERIQAYMLKAMREAKVTTSWTSPNEKHQKAVKEFLERVLNDQNFLEVFLPFQRRIAHFGMLNSLSQTLLKIAAPGVPDTYQGTELWDLSLVDPDNRRPVDYAKREKMLRALPGEVRAEDLFRDMGDGGVKMFLTHKALTSRREHAPLFSSGEYIPCEASGARAANVFAFARKHRNHTAICIVPRLMTQLATFPEIPIGEKVWQDTELLLPDSERQRRFRNVFTGAEVSLQDRKLSLANALAEFPVALLIAEA